MKKTFLKALVWGVIAFQVSCGTNQDNIDILNSTNFPVLNSFSTAGAIGTGSPFTVANPFWLFTAGGFGTYLAPARGIISEIGASALLLGTSYVTIIHSGRLATRAHGLQAISVRPGDSVLAGGTVGIFVSGNIGFQVFLDGTAVCPLSFVSSNIRAGIFINPCQ